MLPRFIIGQISINNSIKAMIQVVFEIRWFWIMRCIVFVPICKFDTFHLANIITFANGISLISFTRGEHTFVPSWKNPYNFFIIYFTDINLLVISWNFRLQSFNFFRSLSQNWIWIKMKAFCFWINWVEYYMKLLNQLLI